MSFVIDVFASHPLFAIVFGFELGVIATSGFLLLAHAAGRYDRETEQLIADMHAEVERAKAIGRPQNPRPAP